MHCNENEAKFYLLTLESGIFKHTLGDSFSFVQHAHRHYFI